MVAPPLLTDLYHPDHLYQTVLSHDAACREIDAKTSGSATFAQQFRSKSANLGPPPYLFATAGDGLGGQPISSIRTGRMLGTPPRRRGDVMFDNRFEFAPPLAEAALPDLDGLSASPCAHGGARGAGASHEAGRRWIM